MRRDERLQLIRKIEQAVRKAAFARVEEVGTLVIEHCFHNDLSAWQDRNPRKNTSFRKLADDPELPISKSTLQRDVGAFVALRTLPQHLIRGLSVTHIAEVLPLEHADRLRFLAMAQEKHFSTRFLHDEVVRFRRELGERRGRPCSSASSKQLARIEWAIKRLEHALGVLADSDRVNEDCLDRLQALGGRVRLAAERLGGSADAPREPKAALQVSSLALRNVLEARAGGERVGSSAAMPLE